MRSILLWRRGEETKVTQTYHEEGQEAGPPASGSYGQFLKTFVIFGKNSYFSAI